MPEQGIVRLRDFEGVHVVSGIVNGVVLINKARPHLA
jgi:hypothetical protein